jgi:hypothetical protein
MIHDFILCSYSSNALYWGLRKHYAWLIHGQSVCIPLIVLMFLSFLYKFIHEPETSLEVDMLALCFVG